MSNWGIRRVALALLALYVGAGLTVVLWPTPVDRGMHGELMSGLAALHAAGAPAFINYAFVEGTANVIMFLPLGVLLTLIAKRNFWFVAPLTGAVASTAAELAQLYFLPNRVPTIDDVIHNSMGAIIGTAIVLIVRYTPAAGRAAGRALRPVVTLQSVRQPLLEPAVDAPAAIAA